MTNPNRSLVESTVRKMVSELGGSPLAQVRTDAWITSQGVDSLGALVLRESLERVLGTFFSDEQWMGFRTLDQLIASVVPAGSSVIDRTETDSPEKSRRLAGGAHLAPDGVLYEDLEIGMPLTGRNNLAEGPLLQRLGDIRWKHMSALCGIPSKLIDDEDGQRLYPTFFYAEIAFPDSRPMSSFGENDGVTIASTLQRFGASMLDGISYLRPIGGGDSAPLPGTLAESVSQGTPAVRLSNIFVKQFGGAEWLKKSRPRSSAFERIPETLTPPDSYALVKEAERAGSFTHPRMDEYVPMTDGPIRREYRLVPDRDLNGAGLVYFANYPVFLDICERDTLREARLTLVDELLDRRTLLRRRSAYLNNASSRDALHVEVEPWVRKLAPDQAPETAAIRLLINYRMYRQSDGRLMMVSSAEKVISGRTLEDVPFLDALSAT
jgi:probable biosynthetic protein (TIGR04098 family)